MEELEISKSALSGLNDVRKKAIRDQVAAGALTLSLVDDVVETIPEEELGTQNPQIGADGIDHSLPVGFGSDELAEKHKKEAEDAFKAQSLPKRVLDNVVETAKEVGEGMLARVDDVVNIVSPVEVPISDSSQTLRKTIDRNMDEYLDGSVPFKVYDKLGNLSQTQNRWNEIIAEGKASKEDVDTYKENRRHLLVDVMGYKSVGQDDKGQTWVEKQDGTFDKLDSSSAKAIIGEVFGDKGEMALAQIGAVAGYKKAKAFGKKGQFLGALAGGATGATVGNLVDQLAGFIETGEKLSLSQRVDEVGKSALADTAGALVAPLVLKGVVAGAKGAYAVPEYVTKKIYRHVVNGNLDGAKAILKSDLGVDDAYMDDAVKQMQSWQNEVVDGQIDLADNVKNVLGAEDKKAALSQLGTDIADNVGNAQAKEELLATAMSHPQALPELEGALIGNVKGAKELEKSIDARAKQALEMMDAHTGTEIKSSVNAYEGRVKAQFSDMVNTFDDAFKEAGYRFDLDDLNIAKNIEGMGERIGDKFVQEQFEAMGSALAKQIDGAGSGSGVTRNIGDLLDVRKEVNRFYGKVEKHLKKPDTEVFKKIKKDIDKEIERALDVHTTPEIKKELLGYFSDANKAYTDMYGVRGTKLYKSMMKEGMSAEERVSSMLKHAKDDAGELQQMLGKLTPEEAGKAEDALLDAVLRKNMSGKSGELQAIDMGKVLDDFDGLSPFLKSDASKKTLKLLDDMHSKFRHDFQLSKAIKGTRSSTPSSSIATTWQGKLEAHTAGKIFNYISTLIPVGATPKRLALQRHLASALRKSRTPTQMAKLMSEMKHLPLNERQNLKSLIKMHNHALAAENKAKAAEVEAELKALEVKIEDERVGRALEVSEFKKPDITELRAMEQLHSDDRFGSFSRIVRNIQDDRANEVEIQKYLEAKRAVGDKLEGAVTKEKKNRLPLKYRDLSDEDVAVIQRVADVSGSDDFDFRKVNRLLRDLKKNGVPRDLEYDKLYDDMRAYADEVDLPTVADAVPLEAPLNANGNSVFAKGADNLLAGAVAGVEEDENGNITLDPEKFILGLGGYTVAKALVKNPRVQKEIKDLAVYALEKVEKKLDNTIYDPKQKLFGGEMATGFDDAVKFSDTADKKQRFWIDDGAFRLQGDAVSQMLRSDRRMQGTPLYKVIEDKKLFSNYPELQDVEVRISNDIKGNGSFDGGRTILMSKKLSKEDFESTLLHEIQHWIQDKEGFAKGGSPEDFMVTSQQKKYHDLVIANNEKKRKPKLEELIRKKMSGEIDASAFKKTYDAWEETKAINESSSILRGDKDAHALYESLAGEQEARAIEAKLKHPELTPYEALLKEEGKIDKPIVQSESGVMEMSPVKSKSQKEKRGLYNVTFNDKKKTMIQDANLDEMIAYEKGNRKYGGSHVYYKHVGDGKKGRLTKEEVLKFGDILRKGKIADDSYRETEHGISYKYEWEQDGKKLQLIVEETNDGKKILSGFSDLEREEGTTRGQPSSKRSITQKPNDVKKDAK